MSGGTLIALAADQIVMSQHAVLGPIDPQVGEFSAASILCAVSRKEDQDVEDATLMLADQAEMAINQMCRQVARLLMPGLRGDVAEHVANELSPASGLTITRSRPRSSRDWTCRSRPRCRRRSTN